MLLTPRHVLQAMAQEACLPSLARFVPRNAVSPASRGPRSLSPMSGQQLVDRQQRGTITELRASAERIRLLAAAMAAPTALNSVA